MFDVILKILLVICNLTFVNYFIAGTKINLYLLIFSHFQIDLIFHLNQI